MLFTPPPHHHWMAVDLPLTAHSLSQPKAIRDDAIRITIMRDGSFFYRNTKVSTEDLPRLIRKAVQEGAERKVYLTVDTRTRYVDVEPVLDEIRAAGIKEVSFLAETRLPR